MKTGKSAADNQKYDREWLEQDVVIPIYNYAYKLSDGSKGLEEVEKREDTDKPNDESYYFLLLCLITALGKGHPEYGPYAKGYGHADYHTQDEAAMICVNMKLIDAAKHILKTSKSTNVRIKAAHALYSALECFGIHQPALKERVQKLDLASELKAWPVGEDADVTDLVKKALNILTGE